MGGSGGSAAVMVPRVTPILSAPKAYLMDMAEPQTLQKPRSAMSLMDHMSGCWDHLRSEMRRPANPKNGPPEIFWHVPQWQAVILWGLDGASYWMRPQAQLPWIISMLSDLGLDGLLMARMDEGEKSYHCDTRLLAA